MDFKHVSVLLDECIENLNINPDGIYVDGTLGGGGHSYEIASRLSSKGRLIGIDRDNAAITAATARLAPFMDRVTIVRDNYSNLKNILADLGIDHVDGILLDLGVSSYQLDEPDRGFSYRFDTPLDMRMDQRQTKTAASIINEYTEEELYRVIKDYGEEKFAKSIAANLVKERAKAPIETTGQVVDIIRKSMPMKAQIASGHPAKRTFQAIRIECNDELEGIKACINDMIEALADEGRICIITFHSLEDRIVKTAFKTAQDPCTCPPNFPVCVCNKKSKGQVISRKPILPSKEELEVNTRSASAKLRVFEKSL